MDLEIIESNNGGELVKTSTDLSVIDGFQNMVYLAMFGGNPGFPTPTDRPEGEQAFDWWGNTFLEENQQFNSLTEYTLNNVALNSSGRIEIEEAVKKDLAFMENFADLTIDVIITGIDKCRIEIILQELDNQQDKEFVFIWDSTEKQLTSDQPSIGLPPVFPVVNELQNGDFSSGSAFWSVERDDDATYSFIGELDYAGDGESRLDIKNTTELTVGITYKVTYKVPTLVSFIQIRLIVATMVGTSVTNVNHIGTVHTSTGTYEETFTVTTEGVNVCFIIADEVFGPGSTQLKLDDIFMEII